MRLRVRVETTGDLPPPRPVHEIVWPAAWIAAPSGLAALVAGLVAGGPPLHAVGFAALIAVGLFVVDLYLVWVGLRWLDRHTHDPGHARLGIGPRNVRLHLRGQKPVWPRERLAVRPDDVGFVLDLPGARCHLVRETMTVRQRTRLEQLAGSRDS